MEIKKTPEADLEQGRFIFFLMGFAVVLSGFFVLLEWQNPKTSGLDWTSLVPVFIENEFEGGNRAEEFVSNIPELEIVYEDYVITDDVPVVEKSEDEVILPPDIEEEEESLPFQVKNESLFPVEQGMNVEDAVTSAEIMPLFPGGQTALIRYIYENIQYPSTALKQRIEGRVWCSFVVETDGSISNVQLEESVYIFLDDEALRVLKNMPAWTPGRTNGENVRVKVYIPIVFKR